MNSRSKKPDLDSDSWFRAVCPVLKLAESFTEVSFMFAVLADLESIASAAMGCNRARQGLY